MSIEDKGSFYDSRPLSSLEQLQMREYCQEDTVFDVFYSISFFVGALLYLFSLLAIAGCILFLLITALVSGTQSFLNADSGNAFYTTQKSDALQHERFANSEPRFLLCFLGSELSKDGFCSLFNFRTEV